MADYHDEHPVYVDQNPADGPADRPVQDKGSPSYEVGYKRPPKHTRFKPDESGNWKGRPKGSRKPDDIKRSVYNRKVTIVIDGKERKVTEYEAAVIAQSAKARAGNLAAFKKMDEDMKRLAAPQDEKKEGVIYIHSECLHEHEDCMAAERAAVEAATKKRSSR